MERMNAQIKLAKTEVEAISLYKSYYSTYINKFGPGIKFNLIMGNIRNKLFSNIGGTDEQSDTNKRS